MLLVGPGWERPIAVGRALHTACPSAHVAFVAPHDRCIRVSCGRDEDLAAFAKALPPALAAARA